MQAGSEFSSVITKFWNNKPLSVVYSIPTQDLKHTIGSIVMANMHPLHKSPQHQVILQRGPSSKYIKTQGMPTSDIVFTTSPSISRIVAFLNPSTRAAAPKQPATHPNGPPIVSPDLALFCIWDLLFLQLALPPLFCLPLHRRTSLFHATSSASALLAFLLLASSRRCSPFHSFPAPSPSSSPSSRHSRSFPHQPPPASSAIPGSAPPSKPNYKTTSKRVKAPPKRPNNKPHL